MGRIVFGVCVLTVLGAASAAWAQQVNCHASYMAQSREFRREVTEQQFCPAPPIVSAVPPATAGALPTAPLNENALGDLLRGQKPPLGAITSPYMRSGGA